MAAALNHVYGNYSQRMFLSILVLGELTPAPVTRVLEHDFLDDELLKGSKRKDGQSTLKNAVRVRDSSKYSEYPQKNWRQKMRMREKRKQK